MDKQVTYVLPEDGALMLLHILNKWNDTLESQFMQATLTDTGKASLRSLYEALDTQSRAQMPEMFDEPTAQGSCSTFLFSSI